MCVCVRHREWKLEFGKCCKNTKKVAFLHTWKIKSQKSRIGKKSSDGKLSLSFWVWEATPVQYTRVKKHQRGCCNASDSDRPLKHLYYKKCDSSSKLTVLSKVLQLELGICLSALALFTGCCFFFCMCVCSFLGRGHSGVFLWGGGLKEGVFVSSILDFGE